MINSVYLSKSFKGIANKRRKRITEDCLKFKGLYANQMWPSVLRLPTYKVALLHSFW